MNIKLYWFEQDGGTVSAFHKKWQVDEALAAKDRDLADANHALLLANSNADAFRRAAEQRQGEIERLRAALEDTLECNDNGRHCDVCHTNIRAALRPTTGASNG